MGLLKFGLCVFTWVLCTSETSADNTGFISSELECVEGQDLPSVEPCTKCVCTQGKIICIDVDCDLEKKENATRSGPPRNSLDEKIRSPKNNFNGPRHPLVDIINKQPITNGLPHLSSVYTKERNVIKMGKPTPNISMILTETHVENVLKTFLTHNHDNDDQYVLIVPEVSQENKYPDKRDTSLADTWEHKYNNKFQGEPSQTVSSEAFNNAPFPTYDSKSPYGVLFNENKQRYSSSIILDDQSSVPLARKPLVFGRPGDNRLLMRPRHFMRNEEFANQQNKNKQFYPYSDSINHNVRSWFDPPTGDEIKSAVKSAVESAVKSVVKSKSQQMLESLARQKGFNFDFSSHFNNPLSSYPLANEDIPNINFHTPDQAFPFSQNKYNYPNQPIIDNYINSNDNSAILYDDDQKQMLGNDQYNIDTMAPSANLPIYINELLATNPDFFKQLSNNLPYISYSNKKQPFVPLPAPIQDPIKYQRPDNRYPEQFYNKQYTPPNNQPIKQCGKTSAVPCHNQSAPDNMSPYNSKKNTSPLPSSQSYLPWQIFQPWSMNKPIEFSKPLNVFPYIQTKQHNKPNNYPNSNLPQGTPERKDNAKPHLPNATPYKQLQPLVNNNYADYKKNALHPNTLLPSQNPAYGLVSSKNPISNKLQIPYDTKPKPSQFWPIIKPNMISNELIPDNAVDNTELAPVPINKPEHKKSFPAKLFNNIPKFFSNIFHKSPHAVAPSYHDDVPSQQNNIPNDTNPEMEPNGLEPSIQNNIPQAPNNIIDDKPNDLAPDEKEHTSNNNEVPSVEYSNMPDYQSHQMKPNGQEQFISSNNGQLPDEDTRPNGNDIETEEHSNIPDYGNHKAKPNEQEPSHPNNISQLPNNMYDDKTSNNELPPDKNDDVPVNTNNIVPQEYNNKMPHEGFSVTPNPIQLGQRPNLLPFMPFQMPFNGNNALFPNLVTNGINYPDLSMNKPANKPKEPKTFAQSGLPILNKEPQTYPNNNIPLFNYMPYMPKIPFSYIPPILVDEPKMYPEYDSLPKYYPLMNKQPVNPQIINNAPKIYENEKPISDHHPNFYKKPINKIPQTFKKPSKTYPKDKPSPFKFYPHKPEKLINHWPSIIYDEPEILLDYDNIPQDYPLIHAKPNENTISNPKELELFPDNKNIPIFNHYHPHQYKEPPQIGNNIPTIYTKPKPKPTFHFYPHKPKKLDNPSPLIFNNEPEINEYENIPKPDKELLTFIKEPNIYPIVNPSPVLNYNQDTPKELTNHKPQIFYDEPENLPNHKNIPIFNDYPLISEPEMYPKSKPSPTYNFPHTAYEPAVNNPQSYNVEPELYSNDEYIPVFNHYPQKYEEQPQYTSKKEEEPKITPKPIFNFYPHKIPVNQSPVIFNDKPEMYPEYENIPIPDSYPQTNKYPVSERPQTFDKAPDMYPEVQHPVFQFVPHRPKEPVNTIPQILYDETDILPDYKNIPIFNDYPLAYENPIYNMPPEFNPMPILYPNSPVSDNSQMVNKPSEMYPKLEYIPIDNFYPHKPQEPENLASPIFYDELGIYPDNSSKPSELYPNINKKPFNDYPQPFKEASQMQPKGENIPKFNNYPQNPKEPVSQIPQIYNEIPQTFPDYINVPQSQNYPQKPIKASDNSNPYNEVPKLQPTMKPIPLFKYHPHKPIKPTNHTPQTLKDESQIYPDNKSNSFKPYPDVDKKPTVKYPQTYPKYKQKPIIKPKEPVKLKPVFKGEPQIFPISAGPKAYIDAPKLQPKPKQSPTFNLYPHKPDIPNIYPNYENYPDNNIKPSEHIPKINNKPFYGNPQIFNEIPKIYPEVTKSPLPNYYPHNPKELIKPILQTFPYIPDIYPDYENIPLFVNSPVEPDIPNMYPDYENIPLLDNISVKPQNPVTNKPQTYYNMPELQPTVKPNPIFKYYPHRPKEPTIYTPSILNNKPKNYPDNNIEPSEHIPKINNKPFYNNSPIFNEIPKIYPKFTNSPMPNYYPHKPKELIKPIPQKLPYMPDIYPDYENIPLFANSPVKPDIPNIYPDNENIPLLDNISVKPQNPVTNKPQTYNNMPQLQPTVKPNPIFKYYPHRPEEPTIYTPGILNNKPENYPDNNIEPSEHIPKIDNKPFYNNSPNFNEIPKIYPEVTKSAMPNYYPYKPKELIKPIPHTLPYMPDINPDYENIPLFANSPVKPDIPNIYPDYENIPLLDNISVKPQNPVTNKPQTYNNMPQLQPTVKPNPIFKYYPHRPEEPTIYTPGILNNKPENYPDNNIEPSEHIPKTDNKPFYNNSPIFNEIPKIYPEVTKSPMPNYYPHKPKELIKPISQTFPYMPDIYPDYENIPLFANSPVKPHIPNMYPDYENIPLLDNISVKPQNPVTNKPPTYNNMPELQPTVKPNPISKYYPHRPKEPIINTPGILNNKPKNYPDNNIEPSEHIPKIDNKPFYNNSPNFNEIPKIYPEVTKSPMPNYYPYKPKELIKPIPHTLPYMPDINPDYENIPFFANSPVKPDIPNIYPDYENIPLLDNISVKPQNPVTNKPQTYNNMPQLQPTVKPNPIFKYYPHRPEEPTIYTPGILNNKPENYPDNNIEPSEHIPKTDNKPFYNNSPIFNEIPKIYPEVTKSPMPNYYPHKPKELIKPISQTFPYMPDIYPDYENIPLFANSPVKPHIPNMYPDYENIPLLDNISVKPQNPVTNKPQTYNNMPELQPTVKPNPISKYYPHRPNEPIINTPGILNNKPENYPDNNIEPSEHIPKTDNKPFYNNSPIFNEIPKIYPEVTKSPMPNYYPHKPKELIKPISQTFPYMPDIYPDYENIPLFANSPVKPHIPNMYPDYENIPLLDNISVKPQNPVTNKPQTYNNMPELQPTVKPNPISKYYPHRPNEPIINTPGILNNKPKNYPDNNIEPSEHIPKIDNKPFYNNSPIFNEIPKIYPEVKKSPMPYYYPHKPQELIKPIPQTFPYIPDIYPDYENIPLFANSPVKPDIPIMYPDYENIPLLDNISVKPQNPVTNKPQTYNNMPELQPTVKPNPIFKYYPHRPEEPTIYTQGILNSKPENYPDNNIKPSEHIPKINNKPFYGNPQIFNEIPKIYPELTKSPMPNYYPHKPQELIKPIPHRFPYIPDIYPDYENIPLFANSPVKPHIPNMYPDYENIPLLDNISVKPQNPVTNKPQTYNNMPELQPTVKPNPISKYYPHRPKEPIINTPGILNNKPKNYPDNNIEPSQHIPKIDNKPFYNNSPIFNEIPKIYPEVKKSPMPNYYPHKPQELIKPIQQTFPYIPDIYPDYENIPLFANSPVKPDIPNMYPDYENIPLLDNISVKPQNPVTNKPQTYNNMPELQPTVKPNPIFKYYPHRPEEPTIYTPGILNNKPDNYPDHNIKPSEHIPKINNKPFYGNPQIFNEIPKIYPEVPKSPLPTYYPHKPKELIKPIPQTFPYIPDIYPDYENIPLFVNSPVEPDIPNMYPDYENIPLLDNISVKPQNPVTNKPQTYKNMPELQPTVKPNPIFKYYPHRPEEPTIYTPGILNNKPENYPDHNIKPSEHIPKINNEPFYNNPQIFNEIPKIYPELTKSPMPNYYPHKPQELIKPIPQTFPYIPDIYPDYENIPLFANSPVKPDIPNIYPDNENIPLLDNISVKPQNPVTNKPQTYNNMPELQPTVKPNPIFKYYPHRPEEPTIYTPGILNNKPENYPDNNIKPSEHIPKIDNKPVYNNPPIFNEIPNIYPEITNSPMPNYYPHKPKELIKPIPQTFPYIPDIYPDYENIPLFANSPVKPKNSMEKRPQAYNNLPILKPIVKPSPIFKYFPHSPAEPKRPIILNNAPGNLPDYKEKVNPIVTPKPFTNVSDLYPSNEYIPIFNYFPPKQPSQELNKQSQVDPKINLSPIFNDSPQKPKEPVNFNPEIFNNEEKFYPDYDIISIFDDNLYPSIDEEPTYANLPILNHAPKIYPKDKHKPITSSYPHIPEYALSKDNLQTYNEVPNIKPKVTGRPTYKGYPHIPNQPVNYSPQNTMHYKVAMPVLTPMLSNNHELLSPEEIKEFCRICKMLHCCPSTPLPNSEHTICFDANIDEPHFQYFRPFDSDIHQYPQVPDYSGKGYIAFGWHSPDIQSDVDNEMPYLMTPFYDNLVDVVPMTSDLQKRDIILSDEINGILPIIAGLHKTDELYDKELGMILSPFDYFDPSNSIKYHDLPVKSEIPKPKITQSKPDIYELGNNKNDLTDETTKYNLNKPDGSEVYNQKLESNFDSFIHFDHKGDKDGVDSEKNIWQSTELISKQPQVTGNINGNTAKESVIPKKQSKSSIDYSDFDNLPTYIDTKVRNSDPIRPKRYLVQRDSSKVVEDNSINVPSVFNNIGKAMKYVRQSRKC